MYGVTDRRPDGQTDDSRTDRSLDVMMPIAIADYIVWQVRLTNSNTGYAPIVYIVKGFNATFK